MTVYKNLHGKWVQECTGCKTLIVCNKSGKCQKCNFSICKNCKKKWRAMGYENCAECRQSVTARERRKNKYATTT